MSSKPQTALVLSGGGARGAYAVGAVQAIVEILRLRATDPSPFQIFSGTSVGSINTTFFTANAHRGDMGVYKLRDVWSRLDVNTHLQMKGANRTPRGLPGFGRWRFSKNIIDPRPLELLVRRNLSFRSLHRNIESGIVHASMVAAFNIATGQTTIFSELNEKVHPRQPRDPSRREVVGRLEPGHILASSAMPFLFPARKIDGGFYCDGGVRFNTPISPAIRAGADKIVVVTLTKPTALSELESHLTEYPSAPFLFGRLLNALLLEPVDYDLEVLERFNRLTSTLEDALPPSQLRKVQRVMHETRGGPYRQVDKLVLSPTKDLGNLANEQLRASLHRYKLGAIARYFLRRAAALEATWEADWAAYLLFDGAYARSLMELGFKDTYERREEIESFFGGPVRTS